MICQLVVNPQTGKPLDEGTLKKHFPREIAVGAAELHARMGSFSGKGHAGTERPQCRPRQIVWRTRVSKDGVTVAKEIELTDEFENTGAQMVREVASRNPGLHVVVVVGEIVFRDLVGRRGPNAVMPKDVVSASSRCFAAFGRLMLCGCSARHMTRPFLGAPGPSATLPLRR